jgi:hypothetical protein
MSKTVILRLRNCTLYSNSALLSSALISVAELNPGRIIRLNRSSSGKAMRLSDSSGYFYIFKIQYCTVDNTLNIGHSFYSL